MSFFDRKKKSTVSNPYPLDKFEPVIRSSVCTGEKTACMKDRESGKLHEVLLIRDKEDLQNFADGIGVEVGSIRTVY